MNPNPVPIERLNARKILAALRGTRYEPSRPSSSRGNLIAARRVCPCVLRIALTVALLLAGCSNSAERSHIYFVDDLTGRLVAVQTNAHQPKELLRELAVANPKDGLVSAVPHRAKLDSFVVRKRVAYVALRGPEPVHRRDFHLTAQVVYTLTEHPGIDAVVLKFNGQPCCIYTKTSPSRLWTKPVRRSLFSNWAGAPR